MIRLRDLSHADHTGHASAVIEQLPEDQLCTSNAGHDRGWYDSVAKERYGCGAQAHDAKEHAKAGGECGSGQRQYGAQHPPALDLPLLLLLLWCGGGWRLPWPLRGGRWVGRCCSLTLWGLVCKGICRDSGHGETSDHKPLEDYG